MLMLILVLTWFNLGIPYDLVNSLLGRTQPVTAWLSAQRDWQSLCYLGFECCVSSSQCLQNPAGTCRHSFCLDFKVLAYLLEDNLPLDKQP